MNDESQDKGCREIEVDILRAMVILHGSAWRSDLHDTLSTIWRLKGLSFRRMVEVSELVPKALEALRRRGLIRWEKRLRGDLSRREPLEDTLYQLEDVREVSETLSGDPVVLRYRDEVMGYSSIV